MLHAPAFHPLFRLSPFGEAQQRQVYFGQRRHALLDAHLAQLALVVDASGVYQYYRPDAANLHALAYRVGGCSGGIADDGYLLACEPIYHRTLANIPAAKEADSRLQFIPFHLSSTIVTPTPPSSTFSGWKVRTSRMDFNSWWIICISMP